MIFELKIEVRDFFYYEKIYGYKIKLNVSNFDFVYFLFL